MSQDENGREVLEYPLHYFEKGQDKSIKLTIKFVSGHARLLHNDVMSLWTEFNENMNELSDIETNLGACRKNIIGTLGDEYKLLSSKINDLKSSKKEAVKNAESIGNDMINKRFEAIEIILDDNGYKDRSGEYKKLFDKDFWLKSVTIDEPASFLTECVYKDQKKNEVKKNQ